MFGHFGFSYVGLIYLLMLFIPNIIWSKHQPVGYSDSNENKMFLAFERIGQVCVTCSVLVFRDFNLSAFSSWSLWLIVSFIFMLMYEFCWIRYFTHENSLKNFYGSFCGIPVPLASLPILAFLVLGIYGKVIWLIASALVLGIGHIGIHVGHKKELK